jgi:UDP-N-acetylmuramate dehydrogenase
VQGAVKEAEPLARYSTYRIGGPATVLMATSAADVSVALETCLDSGVPWFALGLGSNILLPDEGMDALVIRIGKGMDRIQNDGAHWKIGAGLPAPLAARRTAEAGWAGLHVMVGVPGSVGGGVYMNAGCHGAEWSEVIQSVTVARASGDVTVLSRSEIPFRYRQSGLDHCVVLEDRGRAPARIGGAAHRRGESPVSLAPGRYPVQPALLWQHLQESRSVSGR